MAKVTDIADEWFRNLENPSDISIAYAASWIRFSSNLGKLNNLLHTDYYVHGTTLEVIDGDDVEIGSDEIAIYELLFQMDYFQRQAKKTMGVGGVDILTEASSDNGTLRFASRNNLAQTWTQIKKDTKVLLDKMVNNYRFNRATPQHVEGDDANVITTASRITNNGVIDEYNRY